MTAKTTTTAKADPYGMTNKKGNGKGNSKGKGDSKGKGNGKDWRG
jgi:hypothetical protein